MMRPGNSHRDGGSSPRLRSTSATSPSKVGTAYDEALRLLEHRARSEAELRRQLVRKGLSLPDVDAAIDHLRHQKLVDDDDFARQFARARLLGTGASRRRIVQELGRRGVSRGIAEAALARLRDEDGLDASAVIDRVAKKKWLSLASCDDHTRRRRLYAFLARRGFDEDEIRRTVGILLETPAD